MSTSTLSAILTAGLLFLPYKSGAQIPEAHHHGAPAGGEEQSQSEQHCEMMNRGDIMKRGEQAMGFSQEKTTHHFHLAKDGGVIEVAANDPKDATSLGQIRQHLTNIAHLFADGNFGAPMFTHGTTPPGVATMTRLHHRIRYEFEQTEGGGRVRISTANSQALDAIQAFLLFQIVDHQTGDSAAIRDASSKN